MKKIIIYGIVILFLIGIVNSGGEKDYNDVDIELIFGGGEKDYNDVDIELLTGILDPCVCPGLNQNWEIDLNETCFIQDDCDIGTGNITFINNGTISFNATIECKNIEKLPSNQKGYIYTNMIIKHK